MKQTPCQCEGLFQDEVVLSDSIVPAGALSQRAEASCWSVAFSPDGRLFAWSSGYKLVTIIPWNRQTGTREVTISGESNADCIEINAGSLIHSLSFGTATPDVIARDVTQRYRYNRCCDLLLATGLANGKIRIWNCYNGCMVFQLLDHKDVVSDLKFSPDGSFRLASASRDGTLKFWDLTDDGNRYHTLRFSRGTRVYAIAWSPNARRIASVASSHRPVIWSVSDNTFREVLKLSCPYVGHHYEVVDIEFSRDGALVATASYDTRVLVWDAYNGAVLRELRHMNPPPKPIYASGANDHFVRALAFNSHGTHIATVADDGLVRYWNLDNDCCPEQTTSCPDAICITFACASNTIAVGCRGGEAYVYRPGPGDGSHARHVPSLSHLCRSVIRSNIPDTDSCDLLLNAHLLPAGLTRYIKYL